MTATTVFMKHQDALRKEGSVGLPFFNVEVRVVDDHMQNVAVNEVGEIVYRGPGMFKGYYQKPEETQRLLREVGFTAAIWCGGMKRLHLCGRSQEGQ